MTDGYTLRALLNIIGGKGAISNINYYYYYHYTMEVHTCIVYYGFELTFHPIIIFCSHIVSSSQMVIFGRILLSEIHKE